MSTIRSASRPMIVKSLLLSMSLWGSFGFNTAALADDSVQDSRSNQVVLSDIDLSTQDGQRIARERVHQMARTLCNRLSDHLDVARQPNYVACVDRTMAQATEDLQAMVSRKNSTRLARAQ